MKRGAMDREPREDKQRVNRMGVCGGWGLIAAVIG